MTANWVTDLFDSSQNFFVRATTDGAKYVFAFLGALVISLLLTPLCREGARRIGMIDRPDARRINKVPIPRGGGLAVFVAFHAVLWTIVLLLRNPLCGKFPLEWQVRFLIASSLLVTIGLIDDKMGLRPIIKLCGQVAVATILFLSGVHVGGIVIAFPPWLDYLATVFWIVGAINAFNLIDGMDGLATGLAFIAAVGLAGGLLFMGQSADTIPYLVFAGACLGFLRYNFHPASVFLGDTGSMFLGLCVATFPLMTGTRKELIASLGVPLLAMGVPIFDTMLAIWRRTVRALLPAELGAAKARVHVMQPDKDHLHHRILRKTLNQRTAAIILYSASVLLVALGVGGSLLRNRAPGLFLIAFIVAIVVVVRHLARVELWDTGRLLSQETVARRHGLFVPIYIGLDAFALCAAWLASRWLLEMPLSRPVILSLLPLYVVPVFVGLVLSKTYWRVWSRAQMRDFALLAVSLVLSAIIGTGFVFLLGEAEPKVFQLMLLFVALAMFPLIVVRLWRDSVQGVLQMLERRVLMEKQDAERVLIYGGGVRFRSFVREMAIRSGTNKRLILGIIDDDLHLKGRIIAGYTVFGGFHDLPDLVAKWHVDALVITCLMDPKKQKRIAEKAEALGLLVSVWQCEEKRL